MDAPFAATISTEAELRMHYREPSERVQKKKADRLNDLLRRFIAGSPFCLLATADADGRCDVSPRGGPPGFVRTLDAHRIAIPDLSGNNLLDSLANIVANPQAGLLFVIPGRDETLRIEGHACLTTDPEVLALWDDELRRPQVAIGVTVNTVFTHCAKSFRRGRVWDTTAWDELHDVPDTCEIMIEQTGLDVSVADARMFLEANYEQALREERA